MKKLILIAMTISTLLTFTSCETYAQAYVVDDGIVYEYSYDRYPVRYIDGIPYYYYFVDNVWRWVILPEIYRPRIIHHQHPMRYYHQRIYRNPYVYNRPIQRPNVRPDRIHPQSRPDIRGGNVRPGNHSIGHGSGVRPNTNNRPSNHQMGGGHFGGRGGGSFGNSSSRGGRR